MVVRSCFLNIYTNLCLALKSHATQCGACYVASEIYILDFRTTYSLGTKPLSQNIVGHACEAELHHLLRNRTP